MDTYSQVIFFCYTVTQCYRFTYMCNDWALQVKPLNISIVVRRLHSLRLKLNVMHDHFDLALSIPLNEKWAGITTEKYGQNRYVHYIHICASHCTIPICHYLSFENRWNLWWCADKLRGCQNKYKRLLKVYRISLLVHMCFTNKTYAISIDLCLLDVSVIEINQRKTVFLKPSFVKCCWILTRWNNAQPLFI